MKIDCHAHVFLKTLPRVHAARYQPTADATLEAYLDQLDRNGLSHGVLIQPSFLGTDNSYMLQCLGQAGGRLRGVVVVDPALDPNELSRLHAAGVVGIRLNLIGQAVPDVRSGEWSDLLEFMRAHDWHVEVHALAGDLAAIAGPLVDLGVKLAIDHFGRPDLELGIADPGFRYLLSLAATGLVWVKASAAYRLGPAHSALPAQAAAELEGAFGGERLMWGSDWPHTQHEAHVQYADTLTDLDRWGFAQPTRELLLQSTPARFFHIAGEAS